MFHHRSNGQTPNVAEVILNLNGCSLCTGLRAETVNLTWCCQSGVCLEKCEVRGVVCCICSVLCDCIANQ
jgi:hypothetical protein